MGRRCLGGGNQRCRIYERNVAATGLSLPLDGSEDEKVRFDGKGVDQVQLDYSEESSDQSILSFTQANGILISTLKNN